MNEIVDTFANRLNEALRIRNIKPIELAEKTGIDKSKISSYMSGRYKAKQDGVYLIAKALNVSEAWLMGLNVPIQKSINSDSKSKRIPVLGSIPAGVPIEMVENILDYEDISEDMLRGGKEYFALKIDEENGHSMEPEYRPGDILIVLKQDDCENGDDCIVAVNGFDATFKRVYKYENEIELRPLNNEYRSMFYTNKDIQKLPVRILGVVVEFRRSKKRK